MKRLKYLFILFVVIVLTGCSVDYKLTINNDLSLNEEVKASEFLGIIEKKTGLKDEDSIDYMFSMYLKDLPNEKYYYNTESNITRATVTESYNSLDEFSNEFNYDLFEPLKYKKNKNIVSLSAKQTKKLGNHYSGNLIYDEVSISLVIPFKVLKHNADEVKGNTYTWNIEKDKALKTINVKFDTSRSKNGFSFKIKNKKIKVNYGYIVTGVIVSIICLAIVFITVNNRRNNRF